MSARLKPIVQIQSESYSDELIAEMEPMLRAHWQEIATFKDKIPLDPDFPMYAKLDAMGKLLCLTARMDGRLVGYCVTFLTRSGHYKSTLSGLNDVIYVDPDYRSGTLGLRLIREAETRMENLGVVKPIWHVKPGTTMHSLMLRLGYVEDEIMMAKVFDRGV